MEFFAMDEGRIELSIEPSDRNTRCRDGESPWIQITLEIEGHSTTAGMDLAHAEALTKGLEAAILELRAGGRG
jgi:hypothetical protein